GARQGRTLVDSTALDLPGKPGGVDGVPSPTTFCFCPQVVLEPLLQSIAEKRGIDVRMGASLTALDGTRATVGGEVIEARYVIGADGAGSTVRSLLGVSMSGAPPTH